MLKLKDKMSFRGALWSAAIEEAFAGYYLIFYTTLCRENSNFRHIRNIHALKSLDTSTVKVIGRILWSIVKGKSQKRKIKN